MRLLLLALAVLCTALPAAAQYDILLAADIAPDSESSYPGAYDAFREYSSRSFVPYDGRLFFTASDGESWRQLWAFDAATGQASLVADLLPGSAPCPAPPNPPPSPLPPDCNAPSYLTVYEGRLFFSGVGDQGGSELWAFDAASGAASLVADIKTTGNGSSHPANLTVYDGRLFFSADDGEHGREIWAYDATTSEATLVADVRPGSNSSYPAFFEVYDGRLFFSAEVPPHGRELWTYDASTDQISLVADIFPGNLDSNPHSLTVYDGRLFFSADDGESGRELWAYDAITDEIALVAEIIPGTEGGGVSLLTIYDNRLFFRADDGVHGVELWSYDATTDTVQLVVDAGPGSESGRPDFMTEYDGSLFFVADDGYPERELWVYDAATNEATILDFYSGSDCPDLWPETCLYPAFLTVYNDQLFFRGYDQEHGAELWAVSPTPIVNEPSPTLPSALLHAPHPNPAQNQATVTFEVGEAGPVRVEVLDVLGRRVAVLKDAIVAAGEHTARWDAGALPSGLYLVRLSAGDQVHTQRLTLVR